MTREPIRKEPSGRYLVVVDAGRKPDGRRRQLKGRFDTLREARVWLARTRAEVDSGLDMPATKLTVAERCGWPVAEV